MKNTKGITLVALIITIIIMLILVSVSVVFAIKGGLFGYAKEGVDKTNEAMQKEPLLSTGSVNVDDQEYITVDEYMNEMGY